MSGEVIIPAPLRRGDAVAIVSPASVVDGALIDGAAALLRRWGLRPVVAPHAKGPSSGSYAAPERERVADWLGALADPEVRAVLCARGGYGSVQLAAATPRRLLRADPKWVVGFSDVTALHALMAWAGVASLHAPMARHLALEAPDDPCTEALRRALFEGRQPAVDAPPCPLNRPGRAEGRLIGGNMAVLNSLAATPFDMAAIALREPALLFIEDIHEAPYAIDRMLWRLRLAGVLGAVKGLMVGQFTDCRAERADGRPVADRIAARLREWGLDGLPAAYGFPVGHVAANRPLLLGARAALTVEAGGAARLAPAAAQSIESQPSKSSSRS